MAPRRPPPRLRARAVRPNEESRHAPRPPVHVPSPDRLRGEHLDLRSRSRLRTHSRPRPGRSVPRSRTLCMDHDGSRGETRWALGGACVRDRDHLPARSRARVYDPLEAWTVRLGSAEVHPGPGMESRGLRIGDQYGVEPRHLAAGVRAPEQDRPNHRPDLQRSRTVQAGVRRLETHLDTRAARTSLTAITYRRVASIQCRRIECRLPARGWFPQPSNLP